MPKVLKIAVVVGVFPEVSEAFIINQLGFLKQSGHRVTVFCTRHINTEALANPSIEKHQLLNHTKVFSRRELMPAQRLSRYHLGFKVLLKSSITSGFIKLLKSFNILRYKDKWFFDEPFFKVYYNHYFNIHQYDVLHIHFADNAVHLFQQLLVFNKKIVVTFHGFDAHNYAPSFYRNLITLNQIQYTVNTQFTKKKVFDLGFSQNNIKVLPVGLDTTFFKPGLKKGNEEIFTILFVGRFVAFKAPLLVIKILERLIKKGCVVHLKMVGSGPEFASCQDYILEHQLEKHIQLLGNRTQTEIVTLLDNCDVFLFPGIIDETGRCENQGLVIQEAQAMELPVVISDVGGMQEGILDQKTGYVVKSEDEEAFVECIEYLIKHPEKKQQLGKNGRKFVKAEYDVQVLGNQLLNLYTSNNFLHIKEEI